MARGAEFSQVVAQVRTDSQTLRTEFTRQGFAGYEALAAAPELQSMRLLASAVWQKLVEFGNQNVIQELAQELQVLALILAGTEKADAERKATKANRDAFGEAVTDEAVPYMLELEGREATDLGLVKTLAVVAQNQWQVIEAIWHKVQVVLEKEEDAAGKEEERLIKLSTRVKTVDDGGHAQVRLGKDAASERLGKNRQKSTNKRQLLRNLMTELRIIPQQLGKETTIFNRLTGLQVGALDVNKAILVTGV